MFGVEMDRGHRHPHPNTYDQLGNRVDLLNSNPHHLMATSGSPEIFNISHFGNHHINTTLCADLYKHHHHPHHHHHHHHHHHQQQQQQQQQFSGSNHVAVSDQLSSSSVMGVSMNPQCMDNSRIPGKRKNPLGVASDSNYVTDMPNSGSLPLTFSRNYGIPNSNELLEGGFNVTDVRNINPPEYSHGFFAPMESSLRNAGNPGVINLQMESPFGHYHSYRQVHQGNYYTPTSQLGGPWGQFRGNAGDGVRSPWCYPAISCFPGRNLNPSSRDVSSLGGQQESPFGTIALTSHCPSLYNQYQPLVPGMQAPNSHYLGVHTPYGFPVNNILHPGGINSSSNGADPVLRNPRPFPSGASIRSIRPHRQPPQAAANSSGSHMRISSAQDIADMEFLSFYGTENFFDRHSDLRLDIDSMSYEELLALEEQIGDVKTGLSREAILEKLKTRSCTTRSLSKAPSDHMPENGTCIICQVEYAEKERIGTLDCGHEYHAGCITEWLLVKNLCPVCKTTAVPADGIER